VPIAADGANAALPTQRLDGQIDFGPLHAPQTAYAQMLIYHNPPFTSWGGLREYSLGVTQTAVIHENQRSGARSPRSSELSDYANSEHHAA
jgi:hypothetical protein